MLPGWARPRQASEEDRPTDGPSAGGRLGQTRAAPHPRCRGSCVPSLPPMAWALSRHACTLLPCVVPWDLLQRLVGWGQPDPQGRPASGGPKPHRPEQESGPSRTGRSGSPAQAPAALASERPKPVLPPEPRPSRAGAPPILRRGDAHPMPVPATPPPSELLGRACAGLWPAGSRHRPFMLGLQWGQRVLWKGDKGQGRLPRPPPPAPPPRGAPHPHAASRSSALPQQTRPPHARSRGLGMSGLLRAAGNSLFQGA